jgi:hypothetical protein
MGPCFRRDDSSDSIFKQPIHQDTRPHSRGMNRPSFAFISAQQRAWGMPGAQCTRSLACKNYKTHELVTTGPPELPDIPARVGFNRLPRALPGDQAFLTPSLCRTSAKLDANLEASGPHVFAVRKQARSSARRLASTASRTYVRDDRETPLLCGRDGEVYKPDLGILKTRIFLSEGLDRIY